MRVVIARQHRLLGRLGHRPFVEIGAFIGLEALAVFLLHQAHRELVELIALARALRGEHPGAGDVVERGEIFVDVLLSQSAVLELGIEPRENPAGIAFENRVAFSGA